MIDRKKLLTISEASELLKVSKVSLRRWSNSGRLKCYRVGARKERRFDMSDLLNVVSTSSDNLTADMNNEVKLKLEVRTHICTFYKNSRIQWQLLRSHFLEHAAIGKRIIYIYHGDRDRVANWIRSEGLDVEELISNGKLILMSASDTYCLGGHFSSDRMIDFWKNQFTDAKKTGIDKLLITGEMGWASGTQIPGHEQLLVYEVALDHMLEIYPWVTTVCQYPVYQFSGISVFDIMQAHTHIQLEDRLVSGFAV